jgi:hypothetical protein
MNKINLLGVQLFLPLYIYYNNYIALAVYINGIICHTSSKTKYGLLLEIYDTLCNIYFIIYCNYYTLWRPYTLNITLLASSIFILNKHLYPKFTYQNQCSHVLGVQLPFCFCLNKFIIIK